MREKLERIIDILHQPLIGKSKKPRTYRKKARKDFIEITKQKRPGAKKIRKAIGKQLRYIRRDLGHIDTLIEEEGVDLELLKATTTAACWSPPRSTASSWRCGRRRSIVSPTAS